MAIEVALVHTKHNYVGLYLNALNKMLLVFL